MGKVTRQESFEESGARRRDGLVGEFVGFILHSKKLWLVPLIVVLLLMSVLVLLGGTAAAPFIYTLF